jgi:hypothetical protein
MPRADEKTPTVTNGAESLNVIAEALGRLRYGAIQLTVHDGKVMQIDVTERRRIGH